MPAPLHPVPQHYGIPRWGLGHFGINRRGHVTVRPDADSETDIDLYQLAGQLAGQGLSFPVLVRFNDLIRTRVRQLCDAFARAAADYRFDGAYTAVYPIKVNQQRSVAEQVIGARDEGVGLEAGSKPELIAVMALSPVGGVIVCNGYKDREYIRLALIAERLGHRVYIVIEKPSELDIVFAEAERLGVTPRLGVRARLAAQAPGNWQSSGGAKAKFGLGPSQVLALVKRLQKAKRLDWLALLHFHIGSQIPNLRDIRRGLAEAARIYGELRELGVPISVCDVGGGLGIDYEGTGTRHYCSANYSLEHYAEEVVRAFARICEESELPHPDLFSESGRAMTAHHALLITNVIDREPALPERRLKLPEGDVPEPLQLLAEELAALDDGAPPPEIFQDIQHAQEEVAEQFSLGLISLQQFAWAEQCYATICRRLLPRLNMGSSLHRELLDKLNEALAERLYCNFSLFQSMPDAWAIDQIFPVMPLHRLNEAPSVNAVLYDLTCDSDGCMQSYVDQHGIESTLPLHSDDDQPYLLGIFLLGAYQEILGDIHNLFGDTDAVNVSLDGQGGYQLSQAEHGDAIDELLRYVHFDTDEMLSVYRSKLERAGLAGDEGEALFEELRAGLSGYTYFEE